MKVGFARVSTKEQDLEIQLSKLNDFGCEKIFQGKQSGVSIINEEKLIELNVEVETINKLKKAKSGKQKLKDLGLDDDEIQALIGV